MSLTFTVTYYVTGKKTDTAVLYLTDVFGIQLNQNKLYSLLPSPPPISQSRVNH